MKIYDYLPSESDVKKYLFPIWSKDLSNYNSTTRASLSKFFSFLETNFSHFPRTLIQVSDSEQLLGDSLMLSEKMNQSKVKVDLQVYSGLPHLFHLFGFLIPQTKLAFENINKFMNPEK